VAQGKKYDQDFVVKVFEDAGCKLLDRYCNAKNKLKYICVCRNISYIKLSNFMQGGRCKNCLKNKFKLKYDYVKKFFEDRNCYLLSENYINARAKLDYICECGNKSKIVFDSFRKGNRCKKCGNIKNSKKQTLSQDQVAKFFKDQGCKLIGLYKKARLPVEFICKCGQNHKKTLNNFQKVPRCPACSLLGRSGSHHYEWISDREKKRTNDLFRQKCRSMINICIRYLKINKNKKTKELLGYTAVQLREHIFNHKNWHKLIGKKWHLDHIFPIKAFLDYGIRDIKLINCLENLQPLTVVENCVKNDNYDACAFENWLQSKGFKVKSCPTKGQV
jgi:hypothetical protein